ncbi:MAG TPA: DUF1343 domain-containing protein [Chitinophagales bacterium]|nr:DUF1343 domain-containing protein [Chitinophagales bacterium]HNB49130.1 DUF1343 domain-containing protein [Chitinophagales bacterium]HNC70804.1 DUF1343 domain-containing protein [Chitinophagales bacterium]HNF18927.1 DUF1343 domain-containing protein [Chitinophagales bacterium]HNF52332.1 DUF1343 domain-containing protein [Chitinophagales bacterium]
MKKVFLFLFCFFSISINMIANNTVVGAERIDQYLPFLKGKKVGLVVNQTSSVGNTHLLDTLLQLQINVSCVFAPEHGFRGTADAGEHVKNGIDPKTKTTIISLYGDNKKPKATQLKNIDVVLFDIQDVGVRFYTYISTLQYVMEACAENKKALIILDRPNPNGHYVDGPVLDTINRSFVGMQPIPIVHGMTIGEYANMLNGEKWLANKLHCNLTVIKCINYDHNTFYNLPIKPSPNLPNMAAIYLYPSLCFFEGTDHVSLGRGTNKPFQIYGSNVFTGKLPYSFTPKPVEGAKNPPLLDKICYGYDLSKLSLDSLRKQKFTLKYVLKAYQMTPDSIPFFNNFFVKLSGTDVLTTQIKSGLNEKVIKASWKEKISQFKAIRKKYLLYADFE